MVLSQISHEEKVYDSLFITSSDHVCGTKIYFYLLFLVSYFLILYIAEQEERTIYESHCTCAYYMDMHYNHSNFWNLVYCASRHSDANHKKFPV